MSKQGKAKACLKVIGQYFHSLSKFNMVYKEITGTIPHSAMLAMLMGCWEFRLRQIISMPSSYFLRDGSMNKRKMDSDDRSNRRNGFPEIKFIVGESK